MTLRRLRRAAAGRIRPLTAEEKEAFAELAPADRLDRVRVADIPAIPGGFTGITLGTVIGLVAPQPTDGTSHLLAHEMVHVRQWGERGVPGFLGWYLRDYARNLRTHRRSRLAYLEIEAEREARSQAAEWARRRTDPRM